MKGKPVFAITLLALILAFAVGQILLQERVEAVQQYMVEAPLFEVDPSGPNRFRTTGSWAT